jgi:putative transposase
LGLIGGVPPRVAAATKAALLGLVDQAVAEGLSVQAACRVLQVSERRVSRWQARRAAGTLADRPAGGGAVHGLLDEEIEQILELAQEWGEIDRSHRKLAHRGSRLGRVWVSPASVFRVLVAHDLVLPTPPTRAPVQRTPWPDWLEYRPNQVWGWDVTHFGRCRAAPNAFAIIDLVSRKWLATLLSAEETSTQVQVVFTDALEREGLAELVAARQDGRVDLARDDPGRPLLLAVSDNGPQMTSGSTREFLALCSIVQHFGRPHTPPTRPRSRASSATSRASGPIWSTSATPTSSAPNWRWSAPATTPSGCTPASATSPPTTSTPAAAPRSARPAARDLRGLAAGVSPTIASTARSSGRDDPPMRSDHPAIVGH